MGNCNKSSAVAWPQQTQAEKWGLMRPIPRGQLGAHLTQCRLGQDLPPYQMASWSIQPFGHNRHGKKIGVGVPLSVGEFGACLISAVGDRMSAILPHMVWPQCEFIGCRSETCCTRLAENSGRKKSPKNRHLRTIVQICRAMSSQLRHVSTTENMLSSNISSTCPHNMVNLGLHRLRSLRQFGAPQLISTAFASWQRYCTAVKQWASAKLCGVEQRAPPMFGRATITLGIGPHSSVTLCWSCVNDCHKLYRPSTFCC